MPQEDSFQQSSLDLKATHSRVFSTYSNLQKLHEGFKEASQWIHDLGACSPDPLLHQLDENEINKLNAFIADTEQLEDLLERLQQLKPQLHTQVDAGKLSQEVQEWQWPVL
jgi:Zn-dependent oligopeptidase